MANGRTPGRPDDGKPIPANEKRTVGELVEETNAQPRTDDTGRFVSANQNPFPVAQEVRGGTQGEIDTRTGKELTREQSEAKKQTEAAVYEKRTKDGQGK